MGLATILSPEVGCWAWSLRCGQIQWLMAHARSMLQRLYRRIQPESWLDLEKGAEDPWSHGFNLQAKVDILGPQTPQEAMRVFPFQPLISDR